MSSDSRKLRPRDKVEVTEGKYNGRRGEVQSVAEKTCKLKLEDGTVTGNLSFDICSVVAGNDSPAGNHSPAKKPSTPVVNTKPTLAPASTWKLQPRDTVEVTEGKYNGRRGEVQSVAEKTCKLKLEDGTVTGNLSFDICSVVAGNGSPAAKKSTPSPVDDKERHFRVNDVVEVLSGKYKGLFGRVVTASNNTCSLEMLSDYTITGNISKTSLRLVDEESSVSPAGASAAAAAAAGTSPATASAAAAAAAAAAAKQNSVEKAEFQALAIGASQHPGRNFIQDAKEAEVEMREREYFIVRKTALRR
jgi:ribosomal protein L24